MSEAGFMITGLFTALMVMVILFSFVSVSLENRRQSSPNSNPTALRVELEMLVQSIRDLDMDFDMNKITSDVYAEQRKMLLGRATGALHRLDIAQQQSVSRTSLDIEAAVIAFRHQTQD